MREETEMKIQQLGKSVAQLALNIDKVSVQSLKLKSDLVYSYIYLKRSMKLNTQIVK